MSGARWCLLVVTGLATATLACGTSTTVLGSGDGGGGDGGHGVGGSAGAGGEGGAGGLPTFEGPDLFACGLPIACFLDGGHMGSYAPGALACGGSLVVSEEPGAVLRVFYPGPSGQRHETLAALLGDGTVYVQQRTKGCYTGPCPTWKYFDLERCEVEVDPAKLDGCAQSIEPCAWEPGDIMNCAPVDKDWSCPEIP